MSHRDTFETFWVVYPKKVSKQDALKSWLKLKPDAATFNSIMAAIEEQSGSEQWARDGGQFIPYPATWLNGKRWLDEAGLPIVRLDKTQGPLSAVSARIKQTLSAAARIMAETRRTRE